MAGAGPLIALARTGHPGLLCASFHEVLIPQAIREEWRGVQPSRPIGNGAVDRIREHYYSATEYSVALRREVVQDQVHGLQETLAPGRGTTQRASGSGNSRAGDRSCGTPGTPTRWSRASGTRCTTRTGTSSTWGVAPGGTCPSWTRTPAGSSPGTSSACGCPASSTPMPRAR